MPTYDYDCKACGGFEAIRSLATRDEPAGCPDCGASSPRVFVAAPRLALMAGSTRAAMQVNERARHEPRRSSDQAKHAPGCGCCSPGRRGATVTARDGSKGFPGKRPWMISH